MPRLTNEQRSACHAKLSEYDGNRICNMHQMHPKYKRMSKEPWYKPGLHCCAWCTHAPHKKTWRGLVAPPDEWGYY